jgi:hypothetical protein
MPRPRKPTAVLEISGAFDHNPDRRAEREGEPVSDLPIGKASSHLTKYQKKLWREVMSEIPPCVATKADRKVVEVTVLMIEKMRHKHGDACWAEVGKDNAVKLVLRCELEMRSSDYTTLLKCLSQLGMTPADRSKIKVTPASKPDEWETDFGPSA